MARNYGGLSPYYTAANQTLEQYVPMPFQEMAMASEAIQRRGDDIQNQTIATDSLLANIEALAPQHRNYVTNLAGKFREESEGLLDQYGGNASDPEFIRQMKRMNSRYAADPNFRTILTANEKLKVNDKISREMRAKGQLFTRPQFSGVDTSGNLTADVGEVALVDTLDRLRQEYDVAWKSMENNNRGTISNASNINRLNKRVMDSIANQSPEFQRLAQAYQEQGLSPEQATRQIQSDITGLQGQYGIRTERDNSYYSYQLALRQDARASQKHAMEISALKAQLGGGSNSPMKTSTIQGPISNVDLNSDKLSMIKDFRKHIDDTGNLKSTADKRNIGKAGTPIGGASYGMGTNQPFMSNSGASKSNEKGVMDTLNYMRDELGWSRSQGSAKQVADHYERFLKSDNAAPTMYVPNTPAVFNGLDKQFGNNLSGATYYLDGKQHHADDKNIIADLESNKSFIGFSVGKTSDGAPSASLKYRSAVGTGKNKEAVIVEVPLPRDMQNLLRSNLKYSSIMQGGIDNTELNKSGMYEIIDGKIFVPRKTANGLRFAEVDGRIDSNGKLIGSELKRNSNNELNYLPDELVERRLQSELRNVDDYLQYLYK